jgi:hypothetical protein
MEYTTMKFEPEDSSAAAGGIGSTVKAYAPAKPQRRYQLSFAQLIDALTIVQQKQIFISDHAAEYEAERADIMHDIDLMLKEAPPLDAVAILAVIMTTLANRVIWENEAAIRSGAIAGTNVEARLRFTHSVNGVRNTWKNVLTSRMGGRMDYKIDCLAADLIETFGNWNVTQGVLKDANDDTDRDDGASPDGVRGHGG